MSEAILYISHGSRVATGVYQAFEFIEEVMKRIKVPIQEICFLEFAEPDITTGVKRCVEKGATSIIIIPVLLLTAGHAAFDIPKEIKKLKERFPTIDFCYGKTLGVHRKMVDSIHDRIQEKRQIPNADNMVLIVGRGSRDHSVKKDLEKIALLLKQTYHYNKVKTCFMYGLDPHYSDGLQSAQQSGLSRIFIIPYLLFSGILQEKLEKEVQLFKNSSQEFVMCNTLGYHPYVQDVLIDRVKEAMRAG